ncbi:MAG: nitroreductase family protein [Thermodesulfovibrionales bacterium]|nr:nitroreductase family protein [Thermodesulfovibrionales bacterium]
MNVKEAIEKRASVRRFKPEPVPEELIQEMLEAARLAPSGCNAQPWRFKVVSDKRMRLELAKAAHRQNFIAKAPAVIVACADISGYIDRTVSTMQDLGRIGEVADRIVDITCANADEMRKMDMAQIAPVVAFNVAIAVEHMVLRAVELGLGTCWVRLLDEPRVKEILSLDDNLHVVCLLAVGYPGMKPKQRGKLDMKDIII